MNPVRVSVIIPCYNGERLLADTLRSLVAQSQPPHEVIVVDDGSTDGSAAIARSFAPSVTLLQQNNGGESSARNRAL
ncbi:MAG: glycosyltransferase family A protein, partial [Vicinamibacterales bacterium]